MASQEVRTLRAITFRIAAASHHDLTAVIPSAARNLQDCGTLLSSASRSKKDSGEAGVVHKFQTQVNTLLAGRTAEGRWAATILIKTTIELGGYEILSKSSTWVRGLLQNLNKSDPASSKKLMIITLARILLLTHDHQTLVRELTTPSLKDFITICLTLISPKTTGALSGIQKRLQHVLQPIVLDSFARLLPSYPSIFRPHLSHIREITISVLAVDEGISQHTIAAAERLFALLHFSAPKTNVSSPAEAYASTITQLFGALHTTTSFVFRSIIEDWSSLPSNDVTKLTVANDAELSSSAHDDPFGLPAWKGIQSGIARLCSLLSLLRAIVRSPTSEQVSIALGNILDLAIRLCGVTVPPVLAQGKNKTIPPGAGIRVNDQISQTERDTLFVELPSIHAAAIDLFSTICVRLGAASKPLHESIIEQVAWVFHREAFNGELRTSSYTALSHVLETSATGFTKAATQQYLPLLTRCCEDILSTAPAPRTTSSESENGLSADALAPQNKSSMPNSHSNTLEPRTAVVTAAVRLLTTALRLVPPGHIPNRIRSKLDSTAILMQDKEAMLASVLNPPLATKGGAKTPASIMPFLARVDQHGLATEALFRPRVPAIRQLEVQEISEDESIRDHIDDETSDEEVEIATNGISAQAPSSDTVAADTVDGQEPSFTQAVSRAEGSRSAASQANHMPPHSKRAASPSTSSNGIDAVNAPKRQRLTADNPHGNHQPMPTAPAAPQPVILRDTSASSTKYRETVAILPAEALRTPPKANAVPSAPGTITITGDDSDDDFTIPEISLEMDTEDEEDEEDEKGADEREEDADI